MPLVARREVGGRVGPVKAARIDLCEVDQRVHEPCEPAGVARRDLHQFPRVSVRRALERIGQRGQDQRDRRAQLVADVAEERILLAVEVLQGRRASLLQLAPCGIGDGRAELRSEQFEEIAVGGVERSQRVEADHEHAGDAGAARLREWHCERPLRPALRPPRRGGSGNAADLLRCPGGEDVGQRPDTVGPAAGDVRLADGQPDARGAGETRRSGRSGLVGEVHGRELHVGDRAFQRLAPQPARALDACGLEQARRDCAQQAEAACAQHLLRGLGRDQQHAADLAVIVGQRAVGPREVQLLERAVAMERERLVSRRGRLAMREHALEQGIHVIPDLGEHLARGEAESARVEGAERLDLRVVVQQHEVRAPVDGELVR